MEVDTLAFGTIDQSLKVTFGSDGIAWQNSLLFPGLELNEELTRVTKLPGRAKILAEDGQVMAEGPVDAREHPLGDSMIDVTGVTGPPDQEEGPDLTSLALGYEPGEDTGISGLELAYNARLTGTSGHPVRQADRGWNRWPGARARQRHPGPGQTAEDHDRPGSAGVGGGKPRRGLRRRDGARREEGLHQGSGRFRLFGAATARIDDEDGHRHRGPGNGGRDHGFLIRLRD